MDYSPLSEADIQKMLKTIGIQDIDELFKDIPENIRNPILNIGEGLSELETMQFLQHLARKNHVFNAFFSGGGCYHHFIPPVVNEITRRNEFYTSYTPYQAEISQGFLQAIYEYQTSICNLTAMDASNASVYDGATAVAESLIMAKNRTRKSDFIVLQPINPYYREVLDTYGYANEFNLIYSDLTTLSEKLYSDTIAGVVIQNPNFFGELLDIESIIETIRNISKKVLVIYLSIEASSLGILRRPGTLGVDIVCGDVQSLGLPINFGGPSTGYIATTKKLMRKLPGRIVGKTKEIHGDKEGYVLTLQAREQHIKREKALSNICSNEALCMLAVQVFLSALGYSGLRQMAELNIKNLHYLMKKIENLSNLSILSRTPVYNEFLVECEKGKFSKLKEKCISNHICPPLLLTERIIGLIKEGTTLEIDDNKEYILICNTETNEIGYIDDFLQILKEVMG
ncbi:MAG: aminomethyl-transferring glycine dehydrogenase subunit GcvPA [Candidatus Lokiarchaeota archaeon]|nr:aminomethyl-transferring glycine dehydrogenase subunit GcvPA [Candidatus Lokiarchaeota archaeon]